MPVPFPPLLFQRFPTVVPRNTCIYIFSRCNTTYKPKTKVRGPVPKRDNNDEYFCVWGIGFPFLSRASYPSRKLSSKSTRKKQSSRKTYVNSTSSRHMLG